VIIVSMVVPAEMVAIRVGAMGERLARISRKARLWCLWLRRSRASAIRMPMTAGATTHGLPSPVCRSSALTAPNASAVRSQAKVVRSTCRPGCMVPSSFLFVFVIG